MTTKRVLRLTCMSCGKSQRLKVDPDTEDPSGITCNDCGPTTWMSLPHLVPPSALPDYAISWANYLATIRGDQ